MTVLSNWKYFEFTVRTIYLFRHPGRLVRLRSRKRACVQKLRLTTKRGIRFLSRSLRPLLFFPSSQPTSPTSRWLESDGSRISMEFCNASRGRPTYFGQPGVAGRRIRLDEAATQSSRVACTGKFEISARVNQFIGRIIVSDVQPRAGASVDRTYTG